MDNSLQKLKLSFGQTVAMDKSALTIHPAEDYVVPTIARMPTCHILPKKSRPKRAA